MDALFSTPTDHSFTAQSKIYLLEEDDWLSLGKLLGMSHGVFPDCYATAVCSIAPGAQTCSFDQEGDRVCQIARKKFSEMQQFLSSNYPTRNLTKWTFDAYNCAVATGRQDCTLKTYCCTCEDCPQLQFMKVVLQMLSE